MPAGGGETSRSGSDDHKEHSQARNVEEVGPEAIGNARESAVVEEDGAGNIDGDEDCEWTDTHAEAGIAVDTLKMWRFKTSREHTYRSFWLM